MKKLLLILSIGFLLALAAVVVLNLVEEPLSEEVSRVLYKPMQIPTQSYVNAYTYALDLKLEKDHQIRCRKNSDCTAEELEELGEKWEQSFDAMGFWLERYRELLNFGGLAHDIEMKDPQNFRPLTLFHLSNMWFFKMNQLWSEGEKARALNMAMRQRRFYENSLNYNNSLLFYMIGLNVIADTQKFFESKLGEDAGPFQKKYGARPSEVLSLEMDFERLKTQALESELQYSAKSLGSIHVLGDVFPEISKDNFWGFLLGLLEWKKTIPVRLIFDRNETLNEYYSTMISSSNENCIKNGEECEKGFPEYSFLEYLRNPLGKKISIILYTSVGRTLHKMYRKVDEINSQLQPAN